MNIDLADIICVTCGQSPEADAPRRLGEWNDAGHTDSAHEPVWSQTSFPGSIWQAHPNGAKWYGEVVGSMPGDDIDYVYGYADCDEKPDLFELIPEGWRVEESSVTPIGKKAEELATTFEIHWTSTEEFCVKVTAEELAELTGATLTDAADVDLRSLGELGRGGIVDDLATYEGGDAGSYGTVREIHELIRQVER